MEEKKEAGKHHEHHERHVHHEKNEYKIDNDPDKVDLSKIKKNPRIIVSAVLGIIIIVLAVLIIFRTSGVGGETAGKKVVDFLNAKTGGGVEYVSNADKGDVYEINVSYQDQIIPVYVTKDGKYMVATGGITLLETETSTDTGDITPPADVPKTDKPKVQAFIFSYCPYGTQFEKALVPVYDLLKNKADINIVAIGAMHGEYERVESLRQICIEKNYNKDKLFKYLKAFNDDSAIGSCGGEAGCVNPLIQ